MLISPLGLCFHWAPGCVSLTEKSGSRGDPRGHGPREADLALLALLKRPDLFQNVVDSLPPGPARVTLRMWGMIRGHSPPTHAGARGHHADSVSVISSLAAVSTSWGDLHPHRVGYDADTAHSPDARSAAAKASTSPAASTSSS